VIGSAIVETLKGLNMHHPEPDFDPDDMRIE
jgi:hypothetical protein